jgi:hypothetical protein
MNWDLLSNPHLPYFRLDGESTDLRTEKKRLVLDLPDALFLEAWKTVLSKRKEGGELYTTGMSDLCLLTWDILFVGDDDRIERNKAAMNAVFRADRKEPVPWEKAPKGERIRFLKTSQRVLNKANVLNRRFRKESDGAFELSIPRDTQRKRRRAENQIGLSEAIALVGDFSDVEFPK